MTTVGTGAAEVTTTWLAVDTRPRAPVTIAVTVYVRFASRSAAEKESLEPLAREVSELSSQAGPGATDHE